MKITKYGLSPEEIERRSLAGEGFKTIFNMHGIEKTQKLHRRPDDYDVKKYSAKRKKLRSELFIGEKVYILAERIRKKSAPYILAERIRKKSAPGIFYKQSVQNISYFNKDNIFII